MYLRPAFTYYHGTEQRAARGRFLILLSLKNQPIGPNNTFAVVRTVALSQLGHFMCGRANINGRWVYVEGTYGNNGLTRDVDVLPKDAQPLPRALYDAWNKGGGHNGAGSEANALKTWALATFKLDKRPKTT